MSDSMPPPPKPAASDLPPPPPQEPALRCPRCDSTNTKFCYYNNYSLTQPRHFCKSCRRYWTRGGSLRNIPIGGASRKTKKPSRSSNSTADLTGFKLFNSMPPDFPPPFNPYNTSTTPAGSNLIGLNFDHFPVSCTAGPNQDTASIESLSARNLELHWKMQQQRMAMLYGGNQETDNNYNQVGVGGGGGEGSSFVERPQPIFFQNLEAIKEQFPVQNPASGAGNVATEWFFEEGIGKAGKEGSLNDGGAGGGGGGDGWSDDQFRRFNELV